MMKDHTRGHRAQWVWGYHESFAKPRRHVTGAANQAPAGWHALASPSLYLLYQSALHPTVKKEGGEGAVLVMFCMTCFHCLVQYSRKPEEGNLYHLFLHCSTPYNPVQGVFTSIKKYHPSTKVTGKRQAVIRGRNVTVIFCSCHMLVSKNFTLWTLFQGQNHVRGWELRET